MKKITLSILVFITIAISNNSANAQAPTPPRLIYGTSPFQDSLWGIDSTFWNVVFRNGPTLSGFTITGMNGLAFDPTTYETYIIMKVSGVTGRVLGKIDLTTGVCTQVGNLGTNFSSITFDGSGQLWGATGNGATPAETLFKIDKTTATTTLMYAMGSGIDGEVICYNRADDFIYHWSGNGTVVMEKMARTDIAYTPINIPVTGTPGGETFGALYLSPTQFIMSNIASNFRRAFTNGSYPAVALSTNPDDLRGPVMLPQFTTSATTVCVGESFYADAGSLQLFDSIIYNWGDGTKSRIGIMNLGLDGSSHIYTTAGTYTLNIELDNGFVRDTIKSYSVTVNPTPVVTISGSSSICSGVATTLSVSGTGTLQWYMNGSVISGETTNTYTTNVVGVYNLYESNSFGCADSATVGLTLVNYLNPTVTANPTPASVCAGSPLILAGGGAATYVWDNSVIDGVAFNPTGTTTYNVIGTDVNGCTNTAAVSVTVNTLPIVNISGGTSICAGSAITLTGTSGGTSQWYLNGVIISGATTNTYLASLPGVYNMTKTNLSGCADSAAMGLPLIVNALPLVTASSTGDTICSGNSITLNGGGALTYVWDNAAIDNVSFSLTSTTFYTVTGTDLNGCSNSDSILVYVNPLPTVGITGSSTICNGTSATLFGNGAITYVWIGGPSTVSYAVSPTANTTYTVTGTDANGCSNTATHLVTVNAAVNVATTTSGITITATATGSTYLWINCPSGTPAGATTQSFTPTANGNYAVIVTTGGCTDTSACVAITTIGINEYSQNNTIEAFPNPNNGTFVIQSKTEGTYSIVNELGQVIRTLTLNFDNNFTITIDDLNSGLYIIAGVNGNAVVTKRIIVTK